MLLLLSLGVSFPSSKPMTSADGVAEFGLRVERLHEVWESKNEFVNAVCQWMMLRAASVFFTDNKNCSVP